MAAPVAPVIKVKQDGSSVFVSWEAVPTATTYKVYTREESASWSLYVTTALTQYAVSYLSGVVDVKVTAVNAGLEESGDSNVVQKNLRGGVRDGHHGTSMVSQP